MYVVLCFVVTTVVCITGYVTSCLLCVEQQTMELLGQAAADAMVGCLTATCRDVLVPAFDRSCQALFGQVNQTFQAGTAECKCCTAGATTYIANALLLN